MKVFIELSRRILTSDKFINLLTSCSWSNYRIEQNMFKIFNKDFWKEFVDKE